MVKSWNEPAFLDAVEDGLVVVALNAELDEVAAGKGRLPRPQLNVQVAKGRVQQNLNERR